ncbi:conserved hypothetical protein [Desulfofarcimen acetoxidans DSM 771]|uniref:DUF3795 domain-containing protein n=1 Tax=Desulfofarcimen acetoxidans (strain ATCC 49208 / DSM 771 / KCTC 5769 / VKM B-1644 / 5575) TaxID=485916 RepID=C8W3M5_DESAS|nr:DUF3795 domain-containing protein [Desulfofarcimen acetoxidans]ACV63811.1 conserved hypothetical protein [Desulfofarcimen acetoxidans DSM 771]
MSGMIAYCGLICSDCPAYLATQNDDDVAREKTAGMYAEKYGFNLKPGEINCDGCLPVGGRLLGFCRACEIRHCCSKKGLKNCVLCDEKQCEKLIKFHEFSSYAKDCFDALKKEMLY